MRLRSALLTTAACLTIAAAAVPAAGAAAPPVLGPADGVQATLTGQTLEVRFTGTAATAPQIGGQQLAVACSAHPSPPGPQLTDANDTPGSTGMGTVDGQAVLRVKLDGRAGVDACDIVRFDEARGAIDTVARVAFDPAGETWNDEAVRAAPLSKLLDRARGATGYRPSAAVVGGTVVALAGPTATPPFGQVGYWTDGAGHAVAATYSATGRRLLVEDLGRGMLRTNVLVQGNVLDALTAGLFADAALNSVTSDGPSPRNLSRYRAKEPVGPTDGVHAHFAGHRLTVRFTGRSAAAFRAIAGRRVAVLCFRRPAPSLFTGPGAQPSGASAHVRVPRHGGTLTVSLSRAGDLCSIVDAGTSVVFAPATTFGRAWFADLRAFSRLDEVPDRLTAPGGATYLTSAALAAGHPKVMVMATPGATVPVGRVGVWSDGGPHAAVAVTSSSGRRYVMADEGDGTIRTNIYSDLVGLLLAPGG
jgi:hypothetical protein